MLRFFFLFILALLASLALSSCVDGEEEIWINPNGSGNLKAEFAFPPIALSSIGNPDDYVRTLRKIDDLEATLRITHLQFETIKNRTVFSMAAEFDDVRDLLTLAERHESLFVDETQSDPAQLDAIAGDINFRLEGLSALFERRLTLAPLLPSILTSRPGLLGKSKFQYTIHFPAEVEESNAHILSEDRKTVSWTFRLRDSLDQPMIMTARTSLPIPAWIFPALGILILVASYFVWLRFIRR